MLGWLTWFADSNLVACLDCLLVRPLWNKTLKHSSLSVLHSTQEFCLTSSDSTALPTVLPGPVSDPLFRTTSQSAAQRQLLGYDKEREAFWITPWSYTLFLHCLADSFLNWSPQYRRSSQWAGRWRVSLLRLTWSLLNAIAPLAHHGRSAHLITIWKSLPKITEKSSCLANLLSSFGLWGWLQLHLSSVPGPIQ